MEYNSRSTDNIAVHYKTVIATKFIRESICHYYVIIRVLRNCYCCFICSSVIKTSKFVCLVTRIALTNVYFYKPFKSPSFNSILYSNHYFKRFLGSVRVCFAFVNIFGVFNLFCDQKYPYAYLVFLLNIGD